MRCSAVTQNSRRGGIYSAAEDMLRHYYITRDWILSARARRIYLTAAVLSLALLVFLVALPFIGEIRAPFALIVRMFLFAGVVGTATTWVAMEYFLFGFDNSSIFKKAF
jgi:hypothetical protein